jgi:hypothetical protein
MNTPPEAVTDEATPIDLLKRSSETNQPPSEQCFLTVRDVRQIYAAVARLLAVKQAAEEVCRTGELRITLEPIKALRAAIAACHEQESTDGQ